jgi:circadian clock protein KaiC
LLQETTIQPVAGRPASKKTELTLRLGVHSPSQFSVEIRKVSAPASQDGFPGGTRTEIQPDSAPQLPDAIPLRLGTGIEGLNDILHGGFPAGHLYLIEGDPGTGKTTLSLQFLLEGIRLGERVLYVTLSESRQELEQVARSHGWPTDSLLIYEMIPPEDDLKPEAQYTVFHPSEVELADTIASIMAKVDEVQPHRLVFDSLAELRMLARDPLKYRRQILALKRHLTGGHSTVLLLDDRSSRTACWRCTRSIRRKCRPASSSRRSAASWMPTT